MTESPTSPSRWHRVAVAACTIAGLAAGTAAVIGSQASAEPGSSRPADAGQTARAAGATHVAKGTKKRTSIATTLEDAVAALGLEATSKVEVTRVKNNDGDVATFAEIKVTPRGGENAGRVIVRLVPSGPLIRSDDLEPSRAGAPPGADYFGWTDRHGGTGRMVISQRAIEGFVINVEAYSPLDRAGNAVGTLPVLTKEEAKQLTLAFGS